MNLTDLVDHTGVSLRTIRYYIQQGLIPGPDGLGPKATYHQGHAARLRLIRAWQERFLPLAEIRSRLDRLSEDGVLAEAAALAQEQAPERPAADSGSAAAYARRILAQPQGALAVPPPCLAKSAWERHSLTPDIEIHVRRPLSRGDNRRLDQLLDAARTLFSKGTP